MLFNDCCISCAKIQLNFLLQKRITESASFFFDENTSIGTSNIIPGNLKFDLVAFKNLKTLQIHGISVNNIMNMGTIRQTLTQLAWHNTNSTQINEFLLCDCVHKSDERNDTVWEYLENLNLSENKLEEIDTSIKLAPNLRTLILDQNQIQTIKNLNGLLCLQTLSLCENKITECTDLHLELGGNLVHLNLSQNNIHSLKAFRKLFSLVKLDVSCNAIDDIEEVNYVASLPNLEELILTGNPIAGTVDYRSHVMARFGDRCSDIYLDNEKANAQEIDMALVLAALKQSETFSPLLLNQSTSSMCTISADVSNLNLNNSTNDETTKVNEDGASTSSAS